CDEVSRDARRRQTFGAQEFEVARQLAQRRGQVVGQLTTGDPQGEVVEVPAVGQECIRCQAALRLDVVTERLDVVGQGGKPTGRFSRHRWSPSRAAESPCYCGM